MMPEEAKNMDIASFRREKDGFMRSHPQSPLTAAQKKTFSGLHYFPENPAFRFDVTLNTDPERPARGAAAARSAAGHAVAQGLRLTGRTRRQ